MKIKTLLLCALLASLMSSCIVLPYGHDRYYGRDHYWGGWHGDGGRWH